MKVLFCAAMCEKPQHTVLYCIVLKTVLTMSEICTIENGFYNLF